ncbi:MAG TPA: hypothetical protein VGL56_05595 [Fimbriimonadaceae bacterium]
MNIRILPILLVTAAIVGCGPKDDTSTSTASGTPPSTSSDKAATAAKPDAGENSVVGTWTISDKTVSGMTVDLQDGGAMQIKAPFPDIKGVTVQVDGTYKLDADKLTFHMDGTKLIAPDGADSSVKKKVDDANKKLVGGPTKPDETDTIAWKDKDTFTGTNPKGDVITYTRKA